MGLIVALCALQPVLSCWLFAVKSAASARSTFYVIAACSTAAMLLLQSHAQCSAPWICSLTGVTFPFVSMGGSSMLSCWSLAYLSGGDATIPYPSRG